MDVWLNLIGDWYSSALGGMWAWFNSLTREEWIVVLGVAAAGGFLCMRGYGSRNKF